MSAPPPQGLADVDQITFANMERHSEIYRICPDWRKEDVTSDGHSWLSNDLHPAFSADRFVSTDWDHPGFNHQETLFARRFASRVLEADCLVPFWWALISGNTAQDSTLEVREARAARIPIFADLELVDIPQRLDAIRALRDAREEEHVIGLSDPPPCGLAPVALTIHQFIQTKATLRGLARQVRFGIMPDDKPIFCETEWFYRATAPFRGSPSIIWFGPQDMSKHSTAMHGDLISQAWASVSLGFEMVQQFAHAVIGASRSGPECNWSNKYRFHADEKIGAEIRMLESCTFGGVLRQEQDQALTSHYTIDGAEGVPGLWFAISDFAGVGTQDMVGFLPEDEDEQIEQEEGPFYHREWQVPFSWLLEVITNAFWDVDVRNGGQPALEPPKEVGYVMSRDNYQKYGPLHSNEVRDGVVPHGWRMLPRSYLMVSNELRPDAIGAVLFGGFSFGRMALDLGDEGGSGSSGAIDTPGTSMDGLEDDN